MRLDLFPSSILVEERETSISKKELDLISEIDYSGGKGNVKFSADDHILDNKKFSSIKKFIQKCLNKYMKEILGSSCKLVITTSWINISKKGAQHPRHSHPNSFLSGVFYLTDIKDSPLLVYNPNAIIWDYEHAYTPVNAEYWTIPLLKNYCIIFPSTLNHSTLENSTDLPRISLAFNSFFESDIGSTTRRTLLKFNNDYR
tara:strand:+ start:249 stop:851 length:603 start_codon:yes stop_codon:yes gene_type:complete